MDNFSFGDPPPRQADRDVVSGDSLIGLTYDPGPQPMPAAEPEADALGDLEWMEPRADSPVVVEARAADS